jgi:hypothetical protein
MIIGPSRHQREADKTLALEAVEHGGCIVDKGFRARPVQPIAHMVGQIVKGSLARIGDARRPLLRAQGHPYDPVGRSAAKHWLLLDHDDVEAFEMCRQRPPPPTRRSARRSDAFCTQGEGLS